MMLTVPLVLEEELDRRDRYRDRTVNDADNGVRVDAATESCDGCDSTVHRCDECKRLVGFMGIMLVR
jgi:hypothetical protein